ESAIGVIDAGATQMLFRREACDCAFGVAREPIFAADGGEAGIAVRLLALGMCGSERRQRGCAEESKQQIVKSKQQTVNSKQRSLCPIALSFPFTHSPFPFTHSPFSFFLRSPISSFDDF